ncbi:MAG: EamA family transporter [Oscillospiraceae bacterium]
MKTRTMTRTQAELLLAAVIIARSTSYVLTKVGLQDMGKFTLLAVRFLLALAFLAVLFWRRLLQIDRRTLLSGLAMGGIYFAS